jgi:hypothetical protein
MLTMFSNFPLGVNKYNMIDVTARKVATPLNLWYQIFFIKDFIAHVHLSCK